LMVTVMSFSYASRTADSMTLTRLRCLQWPLKI
jgi:hypothetical protein